MDILRRAEEIRRRIASRMMRGALITIVCTALYGLFSWCLPTIRPVWPLVTPSLSTSLFIYAAAMVLGVLAHLRTFAVQMALTERWLAGKGQPADLEECQQITRYQQRYRLCIAGLGILLTCLHLVQLVGDFSSSEYLNPSSSPVKWAVLTVLFFLSATGLNLSIVGRLFIGEELLNTPVVVTARKLAEGRGQSLTLANAGQFFADLMTSQLEAKPH